MPEKQIIKLRAGKYWITAETWLEGSNRYFSFPFNRPLMTELKALEGAKWHGYDPNPRKLWSISESPHNKFQLQYLSYNSKDPNTANPYARYDIDLEETIALIPKERFNHAKQKRFKLFNHQFNGIAHIFVRHHCIVAGEMGTGKSMMAMIAMEMADKCYREKYNEESEWWYVGPRSAISAVQRDWRIWGGFVTPKWFTYEGMVREVRNWKSGRRAPFGVIFDESSKLKNMQSQRSQAAYFLANGVRSDWGLDGYVVLMSGSPAPKSPADWYSQARIACPGFLKEGDIHKFKQRLGIIIMKEGIDRGSYPQLVTWRDNEKKCNVCGLLESDPIHHAEFAIADETHEWQPSVNEVARLYERLKGLVVVYWKKDCLDLPDKHYKTIELKSKPSTLRAGNLILKAARTTIEGLTRLRELSDGFQYIEEPVRRETCPLCKGEKEIEQPREIPGTCANCERLKGYASEEQIRNSSYDITENCADHHPQIEMVRQSCPTCGGIGEVTRFSRTVKEVPCPKEDALISILDEHEEIGRIVIYAGFTGSIDRCVRACHKQKWATIRADQGTVRITDTNGSPVQEKDFLTIFQDRKEDFPKVAFVAHPKSAGMGLTLTASPTIVYYSNTFDFEDRIQSEDRIHRAGMDTERGATIIDLVHLPSDQKVLDNLSAKRDLQALSLGDFYTVMANSSERPD